MERETIVRTLCNSHCGGTCEMKVHVREGKIVYIEPEDREGHAKMCARGHAYRQRVYAPDRLLYPVKRNGPRGSGDFKRISWDEALDTTAKEMKRIRSEYGNAAILHFCSMCDPYTLHHVGIFHRLLCQFGGYTAPWGFISNEAAAFAAGITYGMRRRFLQIEHEPEEFLGAKLIIMWGWNPVTTEQGTLIPLYLARAKEQGARCICVDPRFTDSAAVFADQWIPIRPGTDAAVLLAMAQVIIREGLYDPSFLNKYTVGFEAFRDHLFGTQDGNAKTPEWAEKISQVPAETIRELARAYASIKPAVLAASIGPGRTAYGEQYHRAVAALEVLTGRWRAENWVTPTLPGLKTLPHIPSPPNLVEAEAPPRRMALPYRGASVNSSARVNVSLFADAILKGRAGGYPADYKMLWLSNTNYLNQLAEVNKTVRAFHQLEFILVTEQFMTSSACMADIVLPVCTFFEREDLVGTRSGVFAVLNKVIEPLGESRSQFWICQELARRLGLEDFPYASETELIEGMITQIRKETHLPDLETLRKQGFYQAEPKVPVVGLDKGEQKPPMPRFRTPSGKIEIFSEIAAALNDPLIPPLPTYLETWESPNDPLSAKYPLQLITPHFKRRAHSQFDNLPWLRELKPQTLMMNTHDAESRGIRAGDWVRVFNDRGEVCIPAWVTERIMPGVVSLPQGAWYAPDQKGMDYGGCANVLTRNQTSPGGGFTPHTALVQVEKWS